MNSSAKNGLLLINLGTPASPKVSDVRNYLREFLMDPLVIDIPYFLRWPLVHLLITPRRGKASAKLYEKIWTENGSPLRYNTLALCKKVQDHLGPQIPVRVAMRYGSPSIGKAVSDLKNTGVETIIVFPLYPQYSLASTESSLAEVHRFLGDTPAVFVPPFYDHPLYLEAVSKISLAHLRRISYDMVLFSFHGLPERHVTKTDLSAQYCLRIDACCEKATQSNRNCYRHQCYATAQALIKQMRLETTRTQVCFQSRLGRTPWIRPYTDEFYRNLPREGVKRIAVICPSFVSDCLETLEEVALRGREEFLRHGGEELTLVPSLNAEDIWVDAVSVIACQSGATSFNKASRHRTTREKQKPEKPKPEQQPGPWI